jgi:NTE family protein
METPEVLVLGGGGILGEAWMSAVLAGLDESAGFDACGCDCYIGTSAGSIVAASLVAGLAPGARLGRPASRPEMPTDEADERVTALRHTFDAAVDRAGSAAAPLASVAFASTTVGGAILRRTMLKAVRPGRRSLAGLGRMVELAGARWDGRLRIVALELETGHRVVFGSPDAPELSVSKAVQASCAIPGVFRPVVSLGRTYVDGGAWSPTNIDAADVAGGDRVLCLNPTGSLRPTRGSLLGAFGPMSRGIAAAEALELKNRGAIVTTISPDRASAGAIGTNLMDQRNVRPRSTPVWRRVAGSARRLDAVRREVRGEGPYDAVRREVRGEGPYNAVRREARGPMTPCSVRRGALPFQRRHPHYGGEPPRDRTTMTRCSDS